MSSQSRLNVPIRDGKPVSCIVCGSRLHRKSEHYCSKICEVEFRAKCGEQAPPFRSKWKTGKMKELRDPLIAKRRKTRLKTRELLKQGRLTKGTCVVCGNTEVIAHHENYSRPGDVIWLCSAHHKDYHDGKIGLFRNRLWWNPRRLIPTNKRETEVPKKYETLRANFMKKKRRSSPKPGSPSKENGDLPGPIVGSSSPQGEMITFKARGVSPSEEGDYFQVLFNERLDDDTVYFLIQRGFDYDDEDQEEPDPCYMETHDERLCGHLDIARAELSRRRFYLRLACSDAPAVEILYRISDRKYSELTRIMKTILGEAEFGEIEEKQ